MPQTIGNPLSWGASALFGTGRTVGNVAETLGGGERQVPRLRRMELADIAVALRKGVQDFGHFRSDFLFLVMLYPLIGLALVYVAFDRGLLPLLFPMAAGFALLGPVAGIGLYELSRRREAGEIVGWGDAICVLRTGIVGPVVVLGGFLLMVFTVWLFAAQIIYNATLGPGFPDSGIAFLQDILTTQAGLEMIAFGCLIGLCFALAALVISVISFPMLIDRRVGLPVAVASSMRLVMLNPGVVAAWGMVIAISLAIASAPFFMGLIVVVPILGHATWHFYRAAVIWEEDDYL